MKILGISPQVMWDKDLFLRKPSRKLTREEVMSPEFRTLIKELFSSLYEEPTGVGLAAPQLGIQVQAVVIDVKRNGKKPLVLINPTFVPMSNELVDSTETCLSFPGIAGTVKRYKRVKITAKNLDFEDIEFESDSFLGIVCQHEISHLNGGVYIDKAETTFAAESHFDLMANRAIDALNKK